jgi:succinate dehydrogenase hydrophobic anchor subunit
LPRYLTYATGALALYVALASGELWTGILPGALVAALVSLDYVIWVGRNRPWHDWTVILLLLPAIFAAVWIGVGGLLLDVTRSDSDRLVFEVGPGIGLVGLLCTLIAYHGRHPPNEHR